MNSISAEEVKQVLKNYLGIEVDDPTASKLAHRLKVTIEDVNRISDEEITLEEPSTIITM